MEIREIRKIAKLKGVIPGKMKKTELIRAIQKAEGNVDCFGTSRVAECNEVDCLWRMDCVETHE